MLHSVATSSPSAPAGGDSVAIIGAGPGGLGAAMLLAAAGVRVHIYESAPRVGGRTARIEMDTPAGRFRFDRGPTFFLMPFVLEEIFAATGRRLTDYARLTRLDPMYRLVIERRNAAATVIDTTQDVGRMRSQIAALDPRDADGFEAFLRDNRRKLEVFTPVLRRGFRSLADLLDPSLMAAGPWLNPHLSVHAYLGRYFRDPSLRLAMSFQSKYLGMSPFRCPSLFSILPFIEYEYGVWHPEGGCSALMDAMATACAEMGVTIECGSPVTRVVFDGHRAVGVEAGGRVRRHGQVVLNADASWALSNLIPEPLRRPSGLTDARLRGMKYSCSTYMLYLALRERVDLPHHTIRIAPDYRENLEDISARGRLTEDPSFYVCHAGATDETMNPRNTSGLYVLVPTPNVQSGVDWAAAAPGLRRTALDRVSALIGRPVEPLIVGEQQITPADWAASGIGFGATFNLAHGLDQMLHRRVPHELPGVEGVWFVGGATHPGSGLPVIFLSSQITASRLCRKLGRADPLTPRAAPAPGLTPSLAAAAV